MSNGKVGNEPIYDARSLGVPRMLVLGVQHMFAMFGATVLVPALTGLSVSATLLFAGLGTLLFHLITKKKVPAFLGSSFAFLGGYWAIAPKGEPELLPYACVGVACAGLMYAILSGLFKVYGAKKVMRFFPPIVTGPIIICIGMNLSATAINSCSANWGVAAVAIVVVIACNIWGKGMVKIIPILLGVVASYVVGAVSGNVDVEQAGLNALQTLEVCGRADVPVYPGAKRPLFHERKATVSVHGKDGMGDKGIIHPVGKMQDRRAVDFILDTVKKYPGEVEIAVLGPATNIALAVLTDRDAMKNVKRIWSMGTPGFGPGNATPVSEFNVFIDAEAYALMLDSGSPITIAGFDLCTGNIGLDRYELSYLETGSPAAKFLTRATSVLLQFNIDTRGVHMVDLPDAVAMAAALWPDFVKKSVRCHCHCCTENSEVYGQVIFFQEGKTYESMPDVKDANADVITAVDSDMFTQKFMDLVR